MYPLAEQKYTTCFIYSRDRPGCQYLILACCLLLSCQAFTALLKAITLPIGLNNMNLMC